MVLRRHGVFEPPDVVGLEFACETFRGAGRKRPVTVEGDVGAVADAFGDLADDLDFVIDLRAAKVAIRPIFLVARGTSRSNLMAS